MGNVEVRDLSPVGSDDRRELNLSRNVTYKQFCRHVLGEATEACRYDLPPQICDQVSLYEHLDVSFNCLSELPVELPLRLPHLSHLNISYNRVTALPESFGLLFHLKTAILKHNVLQEFPRSFVHLTKLEKLDVSHNVLRCLPEDLGTMPALARVNVSHNKLKMLPQSLGSSTSLRVLLAADNRLQRPLQGVCDGGSAATLAALRVSCRDGTLVGTTRFNVFPRNRGNQLFGVQNLQSALVEYMQAQTNTTNTPSRIKTPLLPPAGATALDADDLRDKIIGLVYGAAIGNAIGIATEKMSLDECEFHYTAETLTYTSIVRDEHRVQWKQGDWTVDFDQLALVLDSLVRWAGVVDELDFAKSLRGWMNNGFPELGDHSGFTVCDTLTKVVNDDLFLDDPHQVAKQWLHSENCAGSRAVTDNSALARCLILAVPHFHDLQEVSSNAVRICRATHSDPQCTAAAVMATTILALIIQGRHDLSDDKSLETLISEAHHIARQQLNHDDQLAEFNKYISCSDFASVDVREQDRQSDVLKALASGVVALRMKTDFQSSITELVMLGADSDCNACVAGALLGCRDGYRLLPAHWVDGLRSKQVDWLNVKVNLLLDMMAIP